MHSPAPTSCTTSRLVPMLFAAQLVLASGIAAAAPSPALTAPLEANKC